jgi:hypothetical protein
MAADDAAGRLEAALGSGLLGPGEFAVVPGVLPVLFSAPHAVAHPRQGRLKAADHGTGAVALAAALGAGAWAMTMLRTTAYDPNWDAQDPYKAHIGRLVASGAVRAVVDVHGMRDLSLDIEVGTGGGATLPADRVEAVLACLEGYRLVRDARFAARRPSTVTQQAFAAGAVAVQLELTPALRREPAARESLVRRLVALARVVAQPA